MTDTVTVRVLRAHSGDYGFHAEGVEYQTDKPHAEALKVQGLVEIVAAAKASRPHRNKAERPVANKAKAASQKDQG